MGRTTVLITHHGSKHPVLGASARRPILVYQAATSEEELLRIPIPRTSVNKGKKEGLTEREAKHVRLFDAEKPWSKLVRGACLVRPLTR